MPTRVVPNHTEILIVEDSATQREQLLDLLGEAGHVVRAAENGRVAIELARRHPPGCIISDIVMPEMNGYDLCRAVRADKQLKNTPIIPLTSLSDPLDVIEALRCGADNLIRKPYDAKHLLLLIQNILVNRRLRSEGKIQMGVEIYLGGEKHFITSDRQQILDLLISTYEQAVQLCSDLQRREQELDRANKVLNGIYSIAKGLNQAHTEQDVLTVALERALELPDVRAGWIFLRDGKGEFRLAATRNLPPELATPGVMEGDCLCRRKVLAGEITHAANIEECERLQKASPNPLGLKSHVTLPLRFENKIVGIMNLVGTADVLFTENFLRVLNGIGNQIGVAIERCRLHEHLEELVRERTVELQKEIESRLKAERERRQIELQLMQAQKMESIGTLAGGIAHDVNNVLGIILGHASFLGRAPQNLTAIPASVDAIYKAVARGAGLVRQLLTFSRKSELSLQPVHVNEVIEELSRMVTATFPKSVTVDLHLRHDLPAIKADSNQLYQALLNLAINSRDAMSEGGTLTIATDLVEGDIVRGRFQEALYDRYILISVSDTGEGMDEETQRRIFEPFFTTKEPGKGTGLGLSVVYGVVMGHEGKIDLKSARGQGTTFTLYFPLKETPEAARLEREKPRTAIPGGHETILVVEDEEMLRELVSVFLTSNGYRVISAEDGVIALEQYEAHRDDIAAVVCDIGLPRLDGIELIKSLHKRDPAIKCILATGYLDQKSRDKLKSLGTYEYIQKPYQPDELLWKVRTLLDAKR